MKFEYLEGDEACALALKLHKVIPKETINRTTLGALGGIAAAVLSDLVAEAGDEALAKIMRDWSKEIAVKAMMLADIKEEDYFPTVGEA